jgi:hypothetical protein
MTCGNAGQGSAVGRRVSDMCRTSSREGLNNEHSGYRPLGSLADANEVVQDARRWILENPNSGFHDDWKESPIGLVGGAGRRPTTG